MRQFIFLLVLFASAYASGQSKKALGHEELTSWNQLSNYKISADGAWVFFELKKEKGDGRLEIASSNGDQRLIIARGHKAKFSGNHQYVFCQIYHPQDSIDQWTRDKVKKRDMPKDTLAIVNLKDLRIEKIANIISYKSPKSADEAWLAYHQAAVKDTLLKKKESKENGSRLYIRNLDRQLWDSVLFVRNYTVAEKANVALIESTGDDSTLIKGVYKYKTNAAPLLLDQKSYKHLVLSKTGEKASFLAHNDTTNPQVEPFRIYLAQDGQAIQDLSEMASAQMPTEWLISSYQNPYFSESENRLFFGSKPQPILQDTNLLEKDIVEVEVWNWKDQQLFTRQVNQLNRAKEKSYLMMYDIAQNKCLQIANLDMPNISVSNKGDGRFALAKNPFPYAKYETWEAWPPRIDAYTIDLMSGQNTKIEDNIKANLLLSPTGKYVYWFDGRDSAWVIYSNENQSKMSISESSTHQFIDQTNDRPMLPYAHGFAGWTANDHALWVYDAYDVWSIDPTASQEPKRITNGRENNIEWRWVPTNPDLNYIDVEATQIFRLYNDANKYAGIGSFKDGNLSTIKALGPYLYRSIDKAKDANAYIYRQENFEQFGDIRYTEDWTTDVVLSDANPQQADYSWGTIELYEWTDLQGNVLQGQLVKPEGFDPNKQYPMIVNFYERSSQGLYRHRAPFPHRSTINYAFYASKGYLIFNPDVPYKIGYPGESAENAVLSGVSALIAEGFVDKAKIGVQGHSWGGYQVAHLISRSDIFACAESGAPVVNMFSAYGGIRWGSGLSRMFQYEQTQSRIGATIWDKPLRYLENSPLFFLDKVNTPVLILHNDADGAVPWYQGIEYFVGLRRLGKPCWMLNYNGEPHWPLKLQNRVDFNIRMQQFFDHYLMDTAAPKWMTDGVPAIEKGILQGLELMDNKE